MKKPTPLPRTATRNCFVAGCFHFDVVTVTVLLAHPATGEQTAVPFRYCERHEPTHSELAGVRQIALDSLAA